ncbi:MAG: NADH-quinone oxidoreductase subunit NuoG [Gammaproteobacteria bacterium]
MIEFEIDGKKLTAAPGTMIIQAADAAGIYIPRFCYHKKLSIAANCRMCLVEVEKAPKTLPACATPIAQGMKIFTQSEKTVTSQKTVMEFLLINHPLDCPICDQGGECELQDLAMGYGRGVSRYNQGKRSVQDKDLGPLVASEMTRCIQCTRCVRFGEEVAGLREMGATGRGEVTEIGTYIEHTLESELSGNIIDVCPVGALTSKPYRFTGRAWELLQHPSIAPHDCLGSNIFLHTRGEEYSAIRHVMRVVPRENEAINEVWLSDRDRYSYEAIGSSERLTQPFLKTANGWEAADWDTALQAVKDSLSAIAPQQLGGLISPNATLEEAYLFQKWLRDLGCDNIDYRLRQAHFPVTSFAPTLGMPIAELENLNAALLIGSDIRHEQPLANHRLRKANQKGAVILSVSPIQYDTNLQLKAECLVGGTAFVTTLANILKTLVSLQPDTLSSSLQNVLTNLQPNATEQKMAEQLLQAGPARALLLGAYAINHPDCHTIYALAHNIARLCQAKLGVLTEGANASGLHQVGAFPTSAAGLNVRQMFENKLPAYILFNTEPELDCALSGLALEALQQAQHVIAFTPFRSAPLEQYATVLLPLATFAETEGTYINVEGKWQTFKAATPPHNQSRPGWQVLAQLSQYPYDDLTFLRKEITGLKREEPVAEWLDFTLPQPSTAVYRVGQWPLYRTDNLVRRAPALQATLDPGALSIRVNPKLAERFNLRDGEVATISQHHQQLRLPVRVDETVADDMVVLPMGLEATAGFGEALGEVSFVEHPGKI